MKKQILSSFLIILFLSAFAQEAKYAIYFADKNDNPFSVDNPGEFLSQRAIDRRERLNIEIDETDLPVNPVYIAAVEAEGAVFMNASKWLNTATFEIADDAILSNILALDFVEKAVLVKPAGIRSELKNSDKLDQDEIRPLAASQYFKASSSANNVFDYGYAENQISMLNGIPLHEKGFAGQGMMIAVLDAGFVNADQMPALDSLFAQNRMLGTRDFVLPGNNVFAPGNHSHGSSVLSTMASWSPGLIVGTAPLANYWLIRTEDGPTEYLIEEYNWVAGAEFADSLGADVINSSLGYTTFNDPEMDHTYEDMNGETTPVTLGATAAGQKGILVCNSAGNSGNDNWHYIGAPADAQHIITVGAVDPEGVYAPFSSVGPTADGRIKPNITAQGSQAIVASTSPANDTVYGGYGTSFSSPIAAGMVACLRQAAPDLSVDEFIGLLEESSSYYQNPDDEYGYGIPDFEMALNLSGITKTDMPQDNAFRMVSQNPVQDDIILTTNKLNALVDVQIMDVKGSIVYSGSYRIESGGHIVINGLSGFSSGIYLLRLQCPQATETIKIIK